MVGGGQNWTGPTPMVGVRGPLEAGQQLFHVIDFSFLAGNN